MGKKGVLEDRGEGRNVSKIIREQKKERKSSVKALTAGEQSKDYVYQKS